MDSNNTRAWSCHRHALREMHLFKEIYDKIENVVKTPETIFLNEKMKISELINMMLQLLKQSYKTTKVIIISTINIIIITIVDNSQS